MPNEIGWYTKDEVQATGLPYWITASKRWTHAPYDFAILLSRSRCKELGAPILSNGYEHPIAFRYASAAQGQHRYIPLYDRTDLYWNLVSEGIHLYDYEQMGIAK